MIDLDIRLSGSDADVGALLDTMLTMTGLRTLGLAADVVIPASFVGELLEACSALRQLSLSVIDEGSARIIDGMALRSLSIRGSVGLDMLERLLVASLDLSALDLAEAPFVARLILRLFKDHLALGQLASLRLAGKADGPRTVETRLLGAMCRLRGIEFSTV